MSGGGAGGTGRNLGSDQRLILILLAVMVVLIVGVGVFAPPQDADSPTPASTNNAPQGVKAAYLTLQALGHGVRRWNGPLDGWARSVDDTHAARTTLVLLDPVYDAVQEVSLQAEIRKFLSRGGRVLATGRGGARLLGGKLGTPNLMEALCESKPVGDSDLAAAGSVQMQDEGGWQMDDAGFKGDNLQAAQMCQKDAVVVEFTQPGTAKRGTAVWWSSAMPMTNAQLKRDPELRLVLASVGEGRDVVFDEALHEISRTQWDVTRGLPIGWVSAQAAALFLLLVASYSRRRGPMRMPVTVPRSSPVEFASSMGDLYEKAGATGAATEAAKRRLLRALVHEVGLAAETMKRDASVIGTALLARLGPEQNELARRIQAHLEEANEAAHGTVTPASALSLVRALSEDVKGLRVAIAPATRASIPAEDLELAGTKERR